MAHYNVTATDGGLFSAVPGQDLIPELTRRVATLPPGAPLVILVHGYRFDPARPTDNPHTTLFAADPKGSDWRVRSWPVGLGFADDTGETGLCVGFGWPAYDRLLPSLVNTRRTGFAHVYDRAGEFGAKLADLIGLLRDIAPDRPVDILAHSLGARVALAALPRLSEAPGRVVLLGAAEFDARAHDFLRASPALDPARVYNFTARSNDLYDAMFETFAPRRNWSDRAIGFGLDSRPPRWIDLQLDRPEVTAWVNSRGIPLTPSSARLCHWSFYTRPGAFAIYQSILRRAPGWDIPDLRATPCLNHQEPRWSRLLSRPMRPRPVRPHAGGLESA